MKRFLAVFAVAVLASIAASVRAAGPMGPTVYTPASVKWTAGTGPMKGTMIALLYGNPDKAGSEYAVRLKLPDGAKFAPHVHGRLEEATVLSGTFLVGVGKKWDDKKLSPLGPGSYAAIPANVPHYGMAQGEVIIELHGVGPESMTMVK